MKDKSNYIAVTYRIPPELVDNIETVANETGLTRSNIVITALNNFINNRNEEITEKSNKNIAKK